MVYQNISISSQHVKQQYALQESFREQNALLSPEEADITTKHVDKIQIYHIKLTTVPLAQVVS